MENINIRKKTNTLLVMVFLLFLSSPAKGDIFESLVGDNREALKKIINTEAGEPNQGVELRIKSTQKSYSENEPIKIQYELLNNSNESRYYWAAEIHGIYNIMIWYPHRARHEFLYLPYEPFVMSGNVPLELKPSESLTGALSLKPSDIPQIYFDLADIRPVTLPYREIFVCVSNDGLYPDEEPREGFPVGDPRGDRILVRSSWIRIKLTK